MANTGEMGIDAARRNVKPRPLTDKERAVLDEFIESIHYSARFVPPPLCPCLPGCADGGASYSDSEYEYRHVQLPKAMLKAIPKEYHDTTKGTLKLLWEDEWRAMGITQVRVRRRRALAADS